MRYKGKTPKRARSMPPLHEFKAVTVGTVKPEIVSGYTITRSEFKQAVELTFMEMPWSQALQTKIREIIQPTVESIDRFPLGSWMDSKRGCGCIVGEAIVANDAVNRHVLMQIENSQHDTYSNISELLFSTYTVEVASALESFGNAVDGSVRRVVPARFPDVRTGSYYFSDKEYPITADWVVFIQDDEV